MANYFTYLKEAAIIRVMAGVRLDMAAANVTEVKARDSK